MKHFKCMKSGIDPQPFLTEIHSIDNAWDASTGRQDKIAVQREALAIPLRGLRKSAIGDRNRRDVHESRWTTGSSAYPVARGFLTKFAEEQNSILGRAQDRVSSRRQALSIRISTVANTTRFAIGTTLSLRSTQGSWLKAADEEIRMKEGELWWFDNNQMHEALNDGDQDRVHMIFDMLPAELEEEVFGKMALAAAGQR